MNFRTALRSFGSLRLPQLPRPGGPRRPPLGSPLQLLLLLATFALAGYAAVRLLAGETFEIVLWFVGAALVHDLVFLPLYVAADRLVARTLGSGRRRGLVNFVRVPALLSLLLLLVWFPLTAGQVRRYEPYTGLSSEPFLAHWLLITAGLFVVSALWLVVRALRAGRGVGAGPGGRAPR